MVTVIPFIYNEQEEDFCSNTYLIKDNSNNCVVVDPGRGNDKLGDYIEKNKLNLKAVLLTHTHIDHMRGVERLIKRFNCKLFVGFDDEIGLTDERYNCANIFRETLIISAKAETISDNDVLDLLEEEIKVIYTPFHTRGSVCYYLSNSKMLFSGDTLFKKVIGRTDLFSSTRAFLRSSLAKLKELPDDVKVYPGHEQFTTIGYEKVNNLFLNR